MTSSVLTVRMDDAKKEKMKRALDREGLNFSSFVNNQADLLIKNSGNSFANQFDDGKTEQEKMIERMSRPANKDIIKNWYTRFRELQVDRPLTKYDTMTKAELAMDKAKKRGWI